MVIFLVERKVANDRENYRPYNEREVINMKAAKLFSSICAGVGAFTLGSIGSLVFLLLIGATEIVKEEDGTYCYRLKTKEEAQ